MTQKEITALAASYITQSFAGMELENPKFDFKREWYNLNDPLKISECLKDTSAMANTFATGVFLYSSVMMIEKRNCLLQTLRIFFKQG